jgi:glycosyltransferase involved in cell wall biosynthesis
MRVAILNYDYLALPTPQDLLVRFAPLQWQAEGLCQAGAEVHVFQRFHTAQDFTLNGVAYHFRADGLPAHLRLTHIPSALHQAIAQLKPDAAHVHGLVFPLQLAALQQALPSRTRLLVQQHSEMPGHLLKRLLQRVCFRGVHGFLFPTAGMAAAWQRARIVPTQRSHLLQETSRHVQPMRQPEARAITNMLGEPALLWMARFVSHKDPLTVLNGFEQAAQVLPGMRLYMGHGNDDPLLPAVQARMAQSQVLQRTVLLLGHIAREKLDAYYASADYFVSGSTRYGGIIALLEAMAHGAVPIVTNIEAYRNMTDDGRIGKLWPVGDAATFAQAVVNAVQTTLQRQQRHHVMHHFEQRTSLPVLSRQLMDVYEQTSALRHKATHSN